MSAPRFSPSAMRLTTRHTKSIFILMRREVEDRIRPAESEVERRHEDAIVVRVCEAYNVHAAVAIAFRAEVVKATSRARSLGVKAANLDNRRMAMGSWVLAPTRAESALEARYQTPQVKRDEVVERGNRESAIMVRAVAGSSPVFK